LLLPALGRGDINLEHVQPRTQARVAQREGVKTGAEQDILLHSGGETLHHEILDEARSTDLRRAHPAYPLGSKAVEPTCCWRDELPTDVIFENAGRVVEVLVGAPLKSRLDGTGVCFRHRFCGGCGGSDRTAG
jgi:hypothetical protein